MRAITILVLSVGLLLADLTAPDAVPLPGEAPPDTASVLVAVASNFSRPADALVREFQKQTGQKIVLTSGSTGVLYAQIEHGAPFAVLLAADELRPRRLEEKGNAVPGSRFTYAVGQLVLWSPEPGMKLGESSLEDLDTGHLAMANPRLAPYGAAARDFLMRLGVWDKLQPRLVLGQNVNQAFGFVQTGNAALGLVAWSSVLALDEDRQGSWWLVPTDQHPPINQQAVLLTDNPVAADFLEFLQSEPARDIIRRYGYHLP